MSMKLCKKCGTMKVLDEFYCASGMRDGRRSDCKACNLKEQHDKYATNPQLAIDRVKRWQAANPEKVHAAQRKARAKPGAKQRSRADHLMRKYGITIGQYNSMLEEQGGGCFICGRLPRPDISLHVDHDHSTGQVRGILCFCCNNALADFQENPALLGKAAGYLSHHAHKAEVALARQRALSLVDR